MAKTHICYAFSLPIVLPPQTMSRAIWAKLSKLKVPRAQFFAETIRFQARSRASHPVCSRCHLCQNDRRTHQGTYRDRLHHHTARHHRPARRWLGRPLSCAARLLHRAQLCRPCHRNGPRPGPRRPVLFPEVSRLPRQRWPLPLPRHQQRRPSRGRTGRRPEKRWHRYPGSRCDVACVGICRRPRHDAPRSSRHRQEGGPPVGNRQVIQGVRPHRPPLSKHA